MPAKSISSALELMSTLPNQVVGNRGAEQRDVTPKKKK
jgi:hypothetical protein